LHFFVLGGAPLTSDVGQSHNEPKQQSADILLGQPGLYRSLNICGVGVA
jgi:hypothetical protein